MQTELRTSTERQAQGQEVQSARMDAMSYRMAEMKDMIARRGTYGSPNAGGVLANTSDGHHAKECPTSTSASKQHYQRTTARH